MSGFFDLYKLGHRGSAMWMGRVQSYSVALFEIELTAAKAPGDYLIVDEQNGQQNIVSFGLSLDGRVQTISPQNRSTAPTGAYPAQKPHAQHSRK